MQNLDLIFLLVVFFVSPVLLGWTARFVPPARRGVFAGTSVVLSLLSVFILARRAVADFGLGGPLDAWVPLACAGLGSIAGWVIFSRMGSLARDLTTESGHLRSLRAKLLSEISKCNREIAELSKDVERVHTAYGRDHAVTFARVVGIADSVKELASRISELHGRLDALRVEFRTFASSLGSPTRLTAIDGSISKRSGETWQDYVADVVCSIANNVGGLRVEVSYERGEPDFVIFRKKKNEIATVGACEAFTLPYRSKGRLIKQRSIYKRNVKAEHDLAVARGVPLFLVVVSKRTGNFWYHVVPQPAEFSRVTTPAWLAEDLDADDPTSEASHNAFYDFMLSLREKDG